MNEVSAMQVYIFICGATIMAMGLAAPEMLAAGGSLGFLQGTLTLGGGLIICGLFSIKMKWHGLIGAGILGLLGAARGAGNLPGFFEYVGGSRPRGSMPVFEIGVAMICLLLVIRVIRVLHQERVRRMLEERE